MFHFRPIPFFGAVAALLLTGCYDSRFGEPDDDGEGKPATETIAALRDRYAGTPFTVTGDIVVTGRVASCDRAENFYRTLCICDTEAGLEVMAGIDHLHNDFPIGSRVTLSLRGLAVAESRGVLQAGRPPAAGSGYATDYIGSRAALGAVLVRSGEALAAPSPAPLAIPALTESRCGTLVRIDGVRYTPEDLSAATWVGYKRFTDADGNAVYTYVRRYARFADAGKTWCDTDPETGRAVATEREIVDTRGRTFTVRTAATCVYAKEPLPQGTGSLYGIIDYFAGKYTLRVTNREAEFSGTAAHSAATRPTAGRPARTTRTTRAGVTAATPPTAYP